MSFDGILDSLQPQVNAAVESNCNCMPDAFVKTWHTVHATSFNINTIGCNIALKRQQMRSLSLTLSWATTCMTI